MVKNTGKPPYKLMSMAELATRPKNGYKVVSLFSGCGGSCLGFRQAGFQVVWSSEFIPKAAMTYTKNKDVGTILDTRDIRDVTSQDILDATGLKKGELDVLEGSPPCAAFSMAGKRHRKWEKVVSYSDSTQRVDDLFFEYARILDGLQPKVFIAENVKGLISGAAKGYFNAIFKALQACGYEVTAAVLNAYDYGVPQIRERVIFCGVRKDLGKFPSYPKKHKHKYVAGDALQNMPPPQFVRPCAPTSKCYPALSAYNEGVDKGRLANTINRLAGNANTWLSHTVIGKNRPSYTIVAQCSNCIYVQNEMRLVHIEEVRRLMGFPDDFDLSGQSVNKQFERMGRSVPPPMMRAVAEHVRDTILA